MSPVALLALSPFATVQIEALTRPEDLLGEGVLWDAEQQALYWVDIAGCSLQRWREGCTTRWALPRKVGSLALCASGREALVALSCGLHVLDLERGTLRRLATPEPALPGQRLNDGTCDPRGRFWVGSMDDAEREPRGHYYCLQGDGRLTRWEAGFLVTNGLGFSRAGDRIYSADSARRRIYVADYDLERGLAGPRRSFAVVPPGAGYPDGLTVDDEDHVWCCHWDGWRVTRYRPDGSVARAVELPVPRPTRCAFGGPARDQLFVTTARVGLDEAALRDAPLSGAVLRLDGLGVRGPGATRFQA